MERREVVAVDKDRETFVALLMITRQAMYTYLKGNIETRLFVLCYSGNAISIIYSVCVCVCVLH
jgi:hydrogenase maturation factor